MTAESGNMLSHSQRAVIKGPVTVQRAVDLAQVLVLSADLFVDQIRRGTHSWEGQFIGQMAK